MTMSRRLLAAALILMAPVVRAQDEAKGAPAPRGPKLQIGDQAPALAIETWVKGDPVSSFEKGKVYVVEFWATWCGPCIQSMPHLTELQKKHKEQGLRVISITSEDPNNSLSKVKQLVAKQGDEKMGYTVAWDKGRTTNEAYMEAAGQNGIPCAFIVNGEGKVAYIGHPMGMDKPLELVIAGKYDLVKARERTRLETDLQESFQSQDWKGAVGKIDAILAVDPEGGKSLSVTKFLIMLLPLQDPDKAYPYGRTLLEKDLKDDAEGLNRMAWIILDEETIQKRDVALAFDMAKRASELTKDADPQILDTLALAHFKKGDAKTAVELQKKAIAAAPAELKEQLEGRLKRYEEGPEEAPKAEEKK